MKVAKAGMWQPLEKRLAEEFLNQQEFFVKKMLLFSWARQPPQKEGAFGKKVVASLECRPAERPLVYITRWPCKRGAGLGWAEAWEPPQMF